MKTISLCGAVAGSWRGQFHSVLRRDTSTRDQPSCSQHCSADSPSTWLACRPLQRQLLFDIVDHIERLFLEWEYWKEYSL